MVKDYTLDIIDSDMFKTVQPVVASLNKLEKDLVDLFKKVQLHENQLQIMVDEVNQEKWRRPTWTRIMIWARR